MNMFTNLPKSHVFPQEQKEYSNEWIKKSIFFVLWVAIGLLIGWKIYAFGNQLWNDRKEVLFAIQNPKVVQAVRLRYEDQKSKLDAQFINQAQPPEIQAITNIQKSVESSLK